ncbi:UDP-N-acetylmuramoyl-L-alanyl-D-glutamate--2,6-diaminopimelate ligase [Patescibacteria group bacterium]|nr:UDP-N-acetylmuramoyl-L-alanyl-D-glutamate--2,6-diaminopimelate ligase [Patescibacteria group bacterium]
MFTTIKKIIPRPLINLYHKLKAISATIYFGFPSRKLTVIGITGTNGKTTTCNMITKILEEEGYKVGMATTINFQIGRKKWVNETKITTLSSWQLQSLLARMVRSKCRYAVIETSSHAIDQNRVWGIDYDIVGITNITREHLDYHHSIEQYTQTKTIIFQNLKKYFKKKKTKKISIINLQDSSWKKIIKYPANKKYAYSLTKQSSIKLKKYPKTIFIHASDINTKPDLTSFLINTPNHAKQINLRLLGRFNVQNALLASCIARSQKIKLKTIKQALEKIDLIPGRMQQIELGQPFRVIIDYALTPDSLEKLYKNTIRPITTGKIIAVLGACGDRDRGKRPIMGEIVATHADQIILTHEDSWTENPEDIIKQLESGITVLNKKLDRDYFIIANRKEAIHKALTLAKPGDTVVITGKGAETKMIYPGHTIDWNEQRVTEELIREVCDIKE